MARGWESKSVESQIEDRAASSRDRGENKSREARELAAKRHSVELSKQRIERELQTARSDAHRAALKNALAHLDSELRRLEH